MIRVAREPWQEIVAHARSTYPNECCGAMLGRKNGTEKVVLLAIPLENSSAGSHRERYELRKEDLVLAENEAQRHHLKVAGIYHSHPDYKAYFSDTDLKNSLPWFSSLLLSTPT